MGMIIGDRRPLHTFPSSSGRRPQTGTASAGSLGLVLRFCSSGLAFALAVFCQHWAGALRGPCGGQDGAKEQRAELRRRGNERRACVSGPASLPTPAHVLPSCLGASRALCWTPHLHLPPPQGCGGCRGAGGQGGGSPRCCPPWSPWRSCRSRCRHWQSYPGGANCRQGAGGKGVCRPAPHSGHGALHFITSCFGGRPGCRLGWAGTPLIGVQVGGGILGEGSGRPVSWAVGVRPPPSPGTGLGQHWSPGNGWAGGQA